MGDAEEKRAVARSDAEAGRPGLNESGEPITMTAEPIGSGVSVEAPAAEQEHPPEGADHQLAGDTEELDSLFRAFFQSTGAADPLLRGAWRPPTDVFETADEVVVKMEVAGVSKKDLRVTFDNRCLYIRGRREELISRKKVAVSQMEVEYGLFERKIPIRQPVDADHIDATYSDGFLIVRIPKVRRTRGRGGSITVII